MLCPNCNTYFEDDFAFCPKCGSKLELAKKDWDKLRNENGKFAYVSKGEQVEFDSMQDLAKGFAEEVMTMALFYKIEECIDEKDYDEAFHILYPVLTENPDYMELWDLLYKIIDKSIEDGKYKDASVFTSKGIEINNQDDFLWHSWGVSFSFLGLHELAMKGYSNAIELNPNNDEYWADKGHLFALIGVKYFNNQEMDEARKNFEEALFYLNQAMKLGEKGKYERNYYNLLNLINKTKESRRTKNSETKVCPKCGTQNSINRTYCERCGEDFPKEQQKTEPKINPSKKILIDYVDKLHIKGSLKDEVLSDIKNGRITSKNEIIRTKNAKEKEYLKKDEINNNKSNSTQSRNEEKAKEFLMEHYLERIKGIITDRIIEWATETNEIGLTSIKMACITMEEKDSLYIYNFLVRKVYRNRYEDRIQLFRVSNGKIILGADMKVEEYFESYFKDIITDITLKYQGYLLDEDNIEYNPDQFYDEVVKRMPNIEYLFNFEKNSFALKVNNKIHNLNEYI